VFNRAGDSSARLLTALCAGRPKGRIKNLLNFANIQSVLLKREGSAGKKNAVTVASS
jgi:hypothetical protein